MAEEDEIEHHAAEKDNEPYDYSQVDPLTAIGFHVEQILKIQKNMKKI